MKLTVGQYQALYEINKSEEDETEKDLQAVSVVTGKTITEVEDMQLSEFKKLRAETYVALANLKPSKNPVSFLKTNGRIYQLNYKIASITAGQHTEVQWWLKEKDWIVNMDKILASIAVEIKKYLWVKLPAKKQRPHNERAEDMQGVDFSEAYGCVVFFCKIFNASIKSTLPFLEKAMEEKGKTKKEIELFRTDLTKTLDGFTM